MSYCNKANLYIPCFIEHSKPYVQLSSLLWLAALLFACNPDPTYSRKIINNTGHAVNIISVKNGGEEVFTIPPFQEQVLDTMNNGLTDSVSSDHIYLYYTDSIQVNNLKLWRNSSAHNHTTYILEVDSSLFTYPEPEIAVDRLEQLISLGVDSLNSWGFKREENVIDTLKEIKWHWLLPNFQNIHPRMQWVFSPTKADFNTIRHVRSASFRKNWKFIIEEWQLEDEAAADRWMDILQNNWHNNYTKPPKQTWQEDNRLYFIVATAAQDWFSHGDKVSRVVFGNSNQLIYTLNEPLGSMEDIESIIPVNGKKVDRNSSWYRPFPDGDYFKYDSLVNGVKGEIIVYHSHEEQTPRYSKIISMNGDLAKRRIDNFSKQQVKTHFGDNYIDLDGTMIYSIHDKMLMIKLENDSVKATKYLRASTPVTEMNDSTLYNLSRF